MAEEQALIDAGHHDGGTEEIKGVPPGERDTGYASPSGGGASPGAGARHHAHAAGRRAEAIRADLDGTNQHAGSDLDNDATSPVPAGWTGWPDDRAMRAHVAANQKSRHPSERANGLLV
jgi:phospholipid/cholesterol/gamma-HCH transport system ATP-binding protein